MSRYKVKLKNVFCHFDEISLYSTRRVHFSWLKLLLHELELNNGYPTTLIALIVFLMIVSLFNMWLFTTLVNVCVPYSRLRISQVYLSITHNLMTIFPQRASRVSRHWSNINSGCDTMPWNYQKLPDIILSWLKWTVSAQFGAEDAFALLTQQPWVRFSVSTEYLTCQFMLNSSNSG